MRPAGERFVKFIVNPVSGNGRTRKVLPHLVSLAKRIGMDFDMQLTQAPEHATELAREHSSEFDIVVAVGGDGTVNEVAAGAVKSKAVMGVIPTGTGNDFVRAMGRLKSLQDYIHRIVAGKVKAIDTGILTLNNRELLFVNGIGVGFDAEVARESLNVHRLKGISRYLYAVLKTLSKYKSVEMKIELDDSVIDGKRYLVAVGNGISAGGGFLLTPEARLDDGLLDVCLVSDLSIGRVLQVLPSVLNGSHGKYPEVTMRKAKRIRIKSEMPVSIHRDGEVPSEKVNDFEMRIDPGCLHIVV
ncbi:MAG TPA: diacylglycerol kinase family lipid kinase [Candidatus Kryptobacter bacterium]|nr:diacylglycerol kinase family lipid kinase [Candidatus Kryptobacter bacterium]